MTEGKTVGAFSRVRQVSGHARRGVDEHGRRAGFLPDPEAERGARREQEKQEERQGAGQDPGRILNVEQDRRAEGEDAN
jgi:hypothetical protein